MDSDRRLIEAVHDFPCLWKVKSNVYKDQLAEENSWKELAKWVGLYALFMYM